MASYIEGAIKEYVEDAAAISAICSSRIYWLKAPDRPTLPYVVFFTVSDPHNPLYFDVDGTKIDAGQRLMQFTCIAEKNTTAVNLQYHVMNRLRFASGSINGFTVERIYIENMRQRIDPDTQHYLCDVDARVEYYDA
jgi:hypothetical protein